MIEIKLIGEDALQYIQNEKVLEAKYAQLLEDFNALNTTHERALRSIEKLNSQLDAVTNKASRDAEILKQDKKISFSRKYKEPVIPEVTEEMDTNNDGTPRIFAIGDYEILLNALLKNRTKSERALDHLIKKITANPTIKQVRDKLYIIARKNNINISISRDKNNGNYYFKVI